MLGSSGDGPPWNFAGWQEITSVRHHLFPEDDNLLPHGWTRSTANEIQSYTFQYNSIPDDDGKIRFAAKYRKGVDPIPGRLLWQQWITANWAPVWHMNSRIAKVLTDHNLHPLQLMVDNDLDSVPPSSDYVTHALEPVARELFGTEDEDKYLDVNGLLRPALRDPLRIIIQRVFVQAARQVGSRRDRMNGLEVKARNALNGEHALSCILPVHSKRWVDLKEDLTVAKIKVAVRAVADFRKAVNAMPTTLMDQSVSDMEEELKAFIPEKEESETPMGKSGTSFPIFFGSLLTILGTASRRTYKNLVLSIDTSAEEIEDLFHEYDAFYGLESDQPLELTIHEPAPFTIVDPNLGCDPGVDQEVGLLREELCELLAFADGVPFLFNNYRDADGRNGWHPEFETLPTLKRFSLLHHQLVGVAAIIRHVFSTSKSSCHGVLLADDVGIGKTIQSLAMIAFMAELTVKRDRGLSVPPILSKFDLHSTALWNIELPCQLTTPSSLICTRTTPCHVCLTSLLYLGPSWVSGSTKPSASSGSNASASLYMGAASKCIKSSLDLGGYTTQIPIRSHIES
jgi:SNF2-related domain